MKRLVFLLTGLLVLAGCGIGTDAGPHVLSGARLPDVVPASVTPGNVVVHVFFVGHDQLVDVPRPVTAAGVSQAVDALFKGTTNDDVAAGLRTAIPTDTTLQAATQQDSVATLELSDGFSSIEGQEQILAIAQIVFTATAVPGVSSVSFSIAEKPLDVPRADGTLSSGPVRRADYSAVAPA